MERGAFLFLTFLRSVVIWTTKSKLRKEHGLNNNYYNTPPVKHFLVDSYSVGSLRQGDFLGTGVVEALGEGGVGLIPIRE